MLHCFACWGLGEEGEGNRVRGAAEGRLRRTEGRGEKEKASKNIIERQRERKSGM